ncbi:MAG: DNA repair protein RecN [Lachnospiraceae bacterium]|nr:DNA repair protein RecN [Lachnospiraceae bacterium]
MLYSLHVKNIALIDDVEIDLTEGLNILTGETGAGKSILIDAVNFALGSRMPKDIVRDEGDVALCELVFGGFDEATRENLQRFDIMSTDDQVILQRRVSGGRSVCKVNGETVTASTIREIAEYLLDIHGQHEHQSLLYRKNHKLMLDSFCGSDLDDELCKLHNLYDEYHRVKGEYEDAIKSTQSLAADLDYARFVVNEIEAADVKPGEDEALEADFARMNNARNIAEMTGGVEAALSSDGEGASALTGHALSLLRQISEMDESVKPMYEQLITAEDILGECIRGITDYAGTLEYSEEDYSRTSERLDTINSLKMKYGGTIEAIKERLDAESDRIEKMTDHDSYIAGLQDKMEQLHAALLEICEKVSAIRHKEALILQRDIVEALSNLNFIDSRFEIVVSSDSENIMRDGFDDVEFMISTNPGEPVRPLTSVASGGELSRIMLALKSVLAKRDNIGTLIFDEIDTGISGKTAQLVADRMSYIAQDHQVIAVTHLPQIASHATTHFLIEKNATDGHTSTTVRRLSYDDSVEEIARMLAGEKITDAVRNNAAELKRTYAKK